MAADITPLLISDKSRKTVGGIGLILILAGLFLFIFPPDRVTIEATTGPGAQTTRKTTTASADTASTALAFLITGAGLVAFGINGVKLTKFSSPLVNAETATLSPADQQPKHGATHPLPSGQVEAIVVVRQFLGLSSWNGIKVLRIAAKASGGPVFNFKDLCSRDARMSHDYAFAYLVAASSLTIFAHTSDPGGALVTVWNFAPAAVAELDAEIERRFAADQADGLIKRAEIARIDAFFSGPVAKS